jgi:hypothetical protein
VVVKLPEDVVTSMGGQTGYEPYQMRGKPVMKEWLMIVHPDADAYADDLPLFRQSAAFVEAGQRRPEPRPPTAGPT